ncbi:MAG: YicC family protein [Lautropia sp.]
MSSRQKSGGRPPSGASPATATVHSMTGYAHRTADTELGRLALELRSVNSRFTDLHFRLGDEVRPLEPLLREVIGRVLKRGKVECRLQLKSRDGEAGRIRVDEQLVARLALADARIRALAPSAAALTVADYLRWHGTERDEADGGGPAGGVGADGGPAGGGEGSDAAAGGPDTGGDRREILWRVARPHVDLAIADFVASRAAEGGQLAATIRAQVGEMRAIVALLRPRVPELLEAARERLTARLQEAMADVQSPIPAEETFARIRQEIALMSLRGDITEELDRLEIHFEAVAAALAGGGAVGKRLDFLTQELNREANTIASKANGIEVTDAAVALKLLIEQMREQVQNLE